MKVLMPVYPCFLLSAVVLSRFVIMMVLNIWVTVTVLRYRKPASKAE